MSVGKKTVAIIINPISGGRDKRPVIDLINSCFPKQFNYEIIVWQRPEEKDEIIKKIREHNYSIVLAAGGDGTINQMAKAVMGTNSVLAILPLGSGNGLARHLHIPLNTRKAIELIAKGKSINIDACTANETLFFCTSGVGFDALIGKLFAESKTRGFYTYFKLIFSNLVRYKAQKYELNIDGKIINTSAFLITFANASQYGNNAYIAPQANICDGNIDVVILKPFKIWQGLFIAQKIFGRTVHLSKYVEVYKGKNIKLTRELPGPVHFDGEPAEMGTSIEYKITQGALKVLAPNDYKINS